MCFLIFWSYKYVKWIFSNHTIPTTMSLVLKTITSFIHTHMNFVVRGIKIVEIGNDSTAFANETTKNSPVVGYSEIYVLYMSTLFETSICRPRYHSPYIPPRLFIWTLSIKEFSRYRNYLIIAHYLFWILSNMGVVW